MRASGTAVKPSTGAGTDSSVTVNDGVIVSRGRMWIVMQDIELRQRRVVLNNGHALNFKCDSGPDRCFGCKHRYESGCDSERRCDSELPCDLCDC